MTPASLPVGKEAGATPTEHQIFVGRQPIYNRRLGVVAYELLFRGSEEGNHAGGLRNDQATAHVLLNTFAEIGLDSIVGQKRAFINFTRDFFLDGYAAVFPANRTVLEVLEDITVNNDLLEAVRDLSVRGYTIALDDFVYQDRLRPLVELADIIKVDIRALGRSALEEQVGLLRQHDVRLLAEKVETQEEFQHCRELGFDYFQGYFLCRPEIVRGRRIPTRRLAILQLLAKLRDPEIEFHELESLISRDVSLSYRLLRLSNSALFGRGRAFTSIRQTLQRLGLDTISAWASILLLARIDDKPLDLLYTAITRANMCEKLAIAMSRQKTETFFLVGLFSLLDALLGRSMSEVLDSLPLAKEINEALLSYEGVLGTVLRCVVNYERGNWEEVGCFDLARNTITETYLDAITRATEMSNILVHSC